MHLLLNLINHKPDILFIDLFLLYFIKFYLYAKDSYEGKYQSLINKIESADLKYFND